MAADNRRVYLTDAPHEQSKLARKHLTRQEFGKRLYTAMLGKGWTQSDLAREAGILRDSVSNYIRALALPTPQNLKKLAKALKMSEADLLPNIDEAAIDQETNPALEVKVSKDDPTRAWVRLNREISMDTFTKIATLLNEEDQSAAKGRR